MATQHDLRGSTLRQPSNPEFPLQTAQQTSVLISEPEVIFSTAAAAAAVPMRPSTIRSWILATWRRIFPTVPPRRRYLDDAVMGREIYRL
jgi:hypothetical protein